MWDSPSIKAIRERTRFAISVTEEDSNGFKETPAGGNFTFDCSPSGPCIPCSRSEKTKSFLKMKTIWSSMYMMALLSSLLTFYFWIWFRRSKRPQRKRTRSALESTDLLVNDGPRRRLLSDTAKSESVSGAYVTYRSCIPAVSEEKLSVLGFQALMMALLLSSGSFLYFRRKRSAAATAAAVGLVRLPTNSRF
ncbi:uncharacterized protein LOC142534661 [Primulina tabacum]|uniref:uncharacterized protein LOC142534661 n=1 Tax=Primulina tabacum TaxID=48773 RepID=UPI003F59CF82